MIVSDFNTMTCGSCSFNDGTYYTSYPPKYRCTFDGEYYDGMHHCHLDLKPVRHGHWIYNKALPDTCSVCGFHCGSHDYDYEDRYCSHCGAKMDESDDA